MSLPSIEELKTELNHLLKAKAILQSCNEDVTEITYKINSVINRMDRLEKILGKIYHDC